MIVVVPAAGRRSAGRLPSSAAAVALALLLSLHLVVVAVAVGAARGVVQRLPSYHGGGGGGSAGGGPCALAVAPLGYPCEEHQVRVLLLPFELRRSDLDMIADSRAWCTSAPWGKTKKGNKRCFAPVP
jgi:hypothetical protein